MTLRRATPPTPPETRPRATPRFFFLLCLCSLCLIDTPPRQRARAQSTTETSDEVVRVESNLVPVPVFVLDGRGRRVSGLTATDFRVLDDGSEVRIEHFAVGAERVALTFLLDASGSVRDVLSRQRGAARSLLQRFGTNSRFSVLHFSERARIAVPFTRDQSLAEAAFDSTAPDGRRTAIFDAALDAVRSFNSGSDAAERRIVILLSDGLDTASINAPRQVIDAGRAAGVTFYVIHLPLYAPRGDRLAPRPSAKGFNDLAKQTGGQVFTLGGSSPADSRPGSDDLEPIFRAVADDLSSQYVIGFRPATRNSDGVRFAGAPRRIEVTLAPTASSRGRKLRPRALRESYTPGTGGG